jgi:uncharacterized membrane protein
MVQNLDSLILVIEYLMQMKQLVFLLVVLLVVVFIILLLLVVGIQRKMAADLAVDLVVLGLVVLDLGLTKRIKALSGKMR